MGARAWPGLAACLPPPTTLMGAWRLAFSICSERDMEYKARSHQMPWLAHGLGFVEECVSIAASLGVAVAELTCRFPATPVFCAAPPAAVIGAWLCRRAGAHAQHHLCG